MALALNYTAASSNLPAFLESWADGFTYRGNGWFNSVLDASDQWISGTPIPVGAGNNDKSSVIVNGNDFSYTSGVVDGDVDTLELGSNLRYVQGSDRWVQDEGLRVDFSEATLTPAFSTAITDLSQNGSLDALYAYFAEQGTEQFGTAGDDVMLSFAGNDEFTGALGNDTFVFADGWSNDVILDFGTDVGNDDIIDLQAVTNIDGYIDLFFNHSNWWDSANVLTITDGDNTLQLNGYVGTDIVNLILCGNILA
ncbi:hypothetical protein [Pseudorhodoplanes sinuspersici]|nr:hypothetical protein [Pseudorhodoplanes sinuspersici]RKE69357.1 hypothetical protein DFP91_3787 [Pseudorhodoplanes sinuspersici]